MTINIQNLEKQGKRPDQLASRDNPYSISFIDNLDLGIHYLDNLEAGQRAPIMTKQAYKIISPILEKLYNTEQKNPQTRLFDYPMENCGPTFSTKYRQTTLPELLYSEKPTLDWSYK